MARRPLSEAEVRRRLAGRGFGDEEIDRTLDELLEGRLIDDAALARDYVVLRAPRMRLGRERLLRELERRGVDSGTAERAYADAVESGDLDPDEVLRDAVRKRLRGERDPSAAGFRRVYNALLRAGFPAAELYAELKRQRGALEAPPEHGYEDDESPRRS